MPDNTTTSAQFNGTPGRDAPPRTVEQARNAWVMTPRNTVAELERWREYYALAVPRPELEAGE